MTIREWLKNIPQDIQDNVEKVEECWRGNGVHLIFKNKCTLSLQWHEGSYCTKSGLNSDDAFYSLYTLMLTEKEPFYDSEDVELAWWHENGDLEYIEDASDTVIGYQTTDDIEKFARIVMVLEN